MKNIDLIDFIKTYPYIKETKRQFYFIINPLAHFKCLINELKKFNKDIDGKSNNNKKY